MTKRIILSCIAAILFISMFDACKQPQPIVYKDVENLRIRPLHKEPIIFDIKFFNPNPYPLYLKEASMDVYINDSHVGEMHTDSLFEIPELDTFLLPVALTVDAQNAVPIAPQLLLASYATVKLDGHVKVKRKSFYLNIPVHYQGRQKLELPHLKLGSKE